MCVGRTRPPGELNRIVNGYWDFCGNQVGVLIFFWSVLVIVNLAHGLFKMIEVITVLRLSRWGLEEDQHSVIRSNGTTGIRGPRYAVCSSGFVQFVDRIWFGWVGTLAR